MWSVAEAVQCRREDDRGSWLPRKCIAETALRKLGQEIGSARRHTGTEHAETHKEFETRKSFHAAVVASGGERSWIWRAVSFSTTTIGPPHSGQRQSSCESLADETSGSASGSFVVPSN